jgi:hypothetical protein
MSRGESVVVFLEERKVRNEEMAAVRILRSGFGVVSWYQGGCGARVVRTAGGEVSYEGQVLFFCGHFGWGGRSI